MSAMKIIRWGILGCGDVTEVKSGPGFYKTEGSRLVAVMRRDGEKAKDFARRHNVPRWYADADALIADAEVDAVYIATPPGSHEAYALKVLAAGKPCYVEKPMARHGPEAARMLRAFAGKGVPLFVAYYRRAMPRYVKVKELLDAGALGEIQSVSYRYAGGQQAAAQTPPPWRMLAVESGGGVFMDMICHALDLLDFWFGPLNFEEGWARNAHHAYDVEDQVQAAMTTATGIPVSVDANFHAGKEEARDEFALQGTKGVLRLACFTGEPMRLTRAGGAEETIDLPYPPHVAQPLIRTIVEELRGTGRCPATAAAALRTQVLIDDILGGYYGGRADDFWNRAWPGNV